MDCDYLAVDWTGQAWVRYEECYIIGKSIKIGERDWRVIVSTDKGCCADADHKTYVRHRISNEEWVCILGK